MLAIEHFEEETVRVVTALALVVVNVMLGWSVGVGSSAADPIPGGIYDNLGSIPISDCYTVQLSPPIDIKPSVTVCQP